MVCDEAENLATAGILEDIIDQTEWKTWFRYEILQDTDRFD